MVTILITTKALQASQNHNQLPLSVTILCW